MKLPLPEWDFRLRRRPWFWRRGRRDTRATRVPLPHSWNDHDTFQAGVKYYRGPGFYRVQLDLPPDPGADGDRWYFCTGGFYGTGTLFVDGKKVADFDAQFLGVEIDVTARLRAGSSHWLALDLTNDCHPDVLPGIREPDFVLHGGLAAEAWLERRPAAHFARDSAWAWLGQGDDTVGASVELVNTGRPDASLTCRWTLLDAQGVELGRQDQEIRLAGGSTLAFSTSFHLPAPRLWSCEDPYLHDLRLELLRDGVSVDRLAVRTGFRQAEFRPNQGFFLNGKRLVPRGINRHENMPGFGNALPLSVHETDAALIRDMGLNLVRLSHYPQHPHFLAECDRLGILVYAEIATWKSVRGGRWLRNAKRQMRGMVRRDRHHPSVILWGLGNEARHVRAYRDLKAVAIEHDPTRATIYAENHLHRAKRRRTCASADVYGLNYELEAYNEARRLSSRQLVLISEISNMPDTAPGDAAREHEQAAFLLAQYEALKGKPGLCGFCIWCLADYATLRKKRYLRYSGVVDAWRKPKLAASLLRALFSGEPVLDLRLAPPAPDGARTVYGVANSYPVRISAVGRPPVTIKDGPLWTHVLPAGLRGVKVTCAAGLELEVPDAR